MPRLQLYQFAPLADQESSSPFCVKVQYALRYKRLPFEIINVTSPRQLRALNARGKLPVLKYDDAVIPDSTEIIRRIELQHPEPRLYPSGPKMRAWALMTEDWADESLYWHVVYERWQVESQRREIAPQLFAPVPMLLRPLARWAVRREALRQLQNQGIGRLTLHEHRDELRRALDRLEIMVNGHFLCGPELSIADIAVAAQLAGLMIPQTPIGGIELNQRPRLLGWLEGVRAAVR